MDPTLKSVIMLVAGGVVTFLGALYWFKRNEHVKETERIAAEHTELTKRVASLENQLSLVSQTILPMSTAFQAILVKELTHFHTPEVDALLVKVGPPNVLTPAEEKELEIALEKRAREIDPLIDEAERDAARMLPMVMKRSKVESEVLSSALRLKLVTVAAASLLRDDLPK